MKHGSLFSGIGGFDLAAQWMGWDNVFHCEWNPFGQQILNHYWPKAISYEDITKTDFSIHRGQIDILTGGFPCQPYSTAGQRKGKDDERHLWPHMLRAIGEIQPRWVVGENVLGLVNWSGGLVFEEVQTQLEDQGYEVQAFVLPACGVGAPHRRERVWFVAYASSDGHKSGGFRKDRSTQGKSESHRDKWERVWRNTGGTCATESTTDNSDTGAESMRGQENSSDRFEPTTYSGGEQLHGDSTNTRDTGLQRSEQYGASDQGERQKYAHRSAGKFREIGNWLNFPTQSPVCSRDDGVPGRLDGITFSKWRQESIKGYGNAIVPQVAHQIFKAIEEYENQL